MLSSHLLDMPIALATVTVTGRGSSEPIGRSIVMRVLQQPGQYGQRERGSMAHQAHQRETGRATPWFLVAALAFLAALKIH
jgi:hypothetical protein